jgi:hypothetical protein
MATTCLYAIVAFFDSLLVTNPPANVINQWISSRLLIKRPVQAFTTSRSIGGEGLVSSCNPSFLE